MSWCLSFTGGSLARPWYKVDIRARPDRILSTRCSRSSSRTSRPECWSGALVGALNGVWVLQNGGAGLQQGLQVGDDLRPAAGHRRDEFRGFALDGVGDGECDRRSTGFQFHRALRLAFRLELGLVLVLPADH